MLSLDLKLDKQKKNNWLAKKSKSLPRSASTVRVRSFDQNYRGPSVNTVMLRSSITLLFRFEEDIHLGFYGRILLPI